MERGGADRRPLLRSETPPCGGGGGQSPKWGYVPAGGVPTTTATLGGFRAHPAAPFPGFCSRACKAMHLQAKRRHSGSRDLLHVVICDRPAATSDRRTVNAQVGVGNGLIPFKFLQMVEP